MKRLLAVGLLTALGLGGALGAGPPPGASTLGNPGGAAADLDALIHRLGDADFATREEATRRLMTRDDATPALRQALKARDAEVARRAAQILEALAHRDDARCLARLRDLAKKGAVDQAAELFARRPTWDDEPAGWQEMTGLATRLIDLSGEAFGEKPRTPARYEGLPAGDFRRWVDRCRPQILRTQQVGEAKERGHGPSYAARGEDLFVTAHFSSSLLLVSAGAVRASELSHCVIFAGGPVDVRRISDSVVVCDGDFTATWGSSRSLIIARGDVRSSSTVNDCRIVTSAEFHLRQGEFLMGTKVKEKVPVPLGFVKFFDPARAGVTVAAAEGGVRVEAAEEGKPFARAGLRPGDVVVALGGAKVDAPESFRRLLRTAVAEGREARLTVRRAGRESEIRIPPP